MDNKCFDDATVALTGFIFMSAEMSPDQPKLVLHIAQATTNIYSSSS